MTNIEFVQKLKKAAECKTLYVKGGFGAPAGYGDNRDKYINSYPYNRQSSRLKSIRECPADTYFFDCVCLGKGVIWGWDANPNMRYGGAEYDASTDIGTETVMSYCDDVSDDFDHVDKIALGEWLYKKGHIGYYIGDGKVVECTIAEKDGVQIRDISSTDWEKHGKIRFIEYVEPVEKRRFTCPCCGAEFVEV